MNLQAFLLCDSYHEVKGKPHIEGVIDGAKPGLLKAVLFLRFAAEPSGSHEIVLDMRPPDRKLARLWAGEVVTNRIHNHAHTLEEEVVRGKYLFSAYVDGEPIGSAELEVR